MQPRRKLLITLAGPIAGLLLAEAIVRALPGEPVPQPVRSGLLFRVSAIPGLTFENRPGAVQVIEYRDRAGAQPRVVEQRVNAQGWRGPLVEPRTPFSYRIACVGDSHTFGAGVGEAEAWPAVLRELARPAPQRFGADTRSVDVLNFGVNAYDTRREVLLLRERVLACDPDLVLLQYHVNDTSARNAFGWKPPYDDWLWKLSAPTRDDWVGGLRAVSKLVDLGLDRLHAARGARDETGHSMARYDPGDSGWLGVTHALLEARDLLRERCIAFGVVLFPSMLRQGDSLSSHAAFDQVAAFCRASGIAVHDAEAALLEGVQQSGRPVDEFRVHPHDPHASAEAHALFAATVLQWLLGPGAP